MLSIMTAQILMAVPNPDTSAHFSLHTQVVYEPKVKYHVGDKPPPRISDSLFGWLPPLINTKEPELLDKAGLDAVAFLRFLRLFRWLFTCIAILTCGILIPINVSYNLKNVPSGNRDALSMLTIRDVGGPWLFVAVAVTYLITALVVVFVYVHWSAMVRLRKQWYRSPEYIQSFYARTLMCTHVPKRFQSDEGTPTIIVFQPPHLLIVSNSQAFRLSSSQLKSLIPQRQSMLGGKSADFLN
jgi:hypothetical protein